MVELTENEAVLNEDSLTEFVPELQADKLELPQALFEAAEL